MEKTPVVLVLVVLLLGYSFWHDYGPSEVHGNLLSEEPLFFERHHPLEYAQYKNYDLNHDGVVTEREISEGLGLIEKTEAMKNIQSIQEYKATSKELATKGEIKSVFVASLGPADRKLIEGLGFEEAKHAVNLPPEFKKRALQLPFKEKISYLKKAIEVENHS